MTRSERRSIIAYAAKLTDEELEKEYYEAVMDSLGSDAERMYEMGYDLQDVLAQEELERLETRRKVNAMQHEDNLAELKKVLTVLEIGEEV